MAAWLDNVRFNPTLGGLTDWTFSSAVVGYQSPAAAGAVNGRLYKFIALSADSTQWEITEGAFNAGVFARTTVLFNSAGTTAKINFATVPQVAVVAVKEDLISVEEANSFTATQQAQARANIVAAASPVGWSRTVLTGGTGTYTTKAGCKAINVRLAGGGAGGGGGGTSGGSAGGTGGTTTFGTLSAVGGNPGTPGGAYTSGGGASGGDLNLIGGGGQFGGGAGFGQASNQVGGFGGASYFGGGGSGGFPGAVGETAQAPGAGGGGGGGPVGQGFGGAGGAAGGYCEKFIASPAASFTFAVGVGGGPGGAATGGNAGGSGAPGIIIIDEYF